MKNLRILEANELGHGILIEMDAGYVSPKDKHNLKGKITICPLKSWTNQSCQKKNLLIFLKKI